MQKKILAAIVAALFTVIGSLIGVDLSDASKKVTSQIEGTSTQVIEFGQ